MRNVLLYQKRWNAARRVSALMFMGGRCERCGNDDNRVLQFDHVHGGGRKDALLHGGGAAIIKRIFATPARFQVLCANCNWIKRAERNENPKQKVEA